MRWMIHAARMGTGKYRNRNMLNQRHVADKYNFVWVTVFAQQFTMIEMYVLWHINLIYVRCDTFRARSDHYHNCYLKSCNGACVICLDSGIGVIVMCSVLFTFVMDCSPLIVTTPGACTYHLKLIIFSCLTK